MSAADEDCGSASRFAALAEEWLRLVRETRSQPEHEDETNGQGGKVGPARCPFCALLDLVKREHPDAYVKVDQAIAAIVATADVLIDNLAPFAAHATASSRGSKRPTWTTGSESQSKQSHSLQHIEIR